MVRGGWGGALIRGARVGEASDSQTQLRAEVSRTAPSSRARRSAIRAIRLSGARLDARLMQFRQGPFEVVGEVPLGVIGTEAPEIGDPPAVVANPRLVGQRPCEFSAGDALARGDRLQHRDRIAPPAAEVVNGSGARLAVEGVESAHDVHGVDV